MSTYNKIVDLLRSENIQFREFRHEPEGRCEAISKIRGNALSQAMKAMVVMAKMNKKDRKYFLAILPGDRCLDMNAIKKYCGAEEGVMLAAQKNLCKAMQTALR